VKVEEVAVLVPLEESAQLRPEDFLRAEREDPRFGLVPATAHLKRVGLEPVEVVGLAGVDLDLEP
jgi:hypothetical protein